MIPQTTVICAVWYADPDRHQLLQGHQANLDRQTVPVERVYVFDNHDLPPAGLSGKTLSVSDKLTVYQAWNVALSLVSTPFVMNLN
ncbi:MAG: glycosyltransferase family 2 protein, partial [Planctomycetes bacterium]|nr:glycosyltransferase family 2 protein [Planctomycetota bacterium]